MATVKQIIEKAYTKANGEYEPLTEADDDFRTYLHALNIMMGVWADTPYVKWQSLYNPNYRLPTVVAQGVLAYPVPEIDRIVLANSPLDKVDFVDEDGKVLRTIKMIDQALFGATQNKNVCALLGGTLYLKDVPEDVVGSRIRLPVYMRPPQYTSANQIVNISSDSWLITAIAAFICDASPVPFIARNADKFEKQAAVLMKTMRANNRQSQILSTNSPGEKTQYGSLSEAINAGVGIGVIDNGQ